jgi:hypothetical protein
MKYCMQKPDVRIAAGLLMIPAFLLQPGLVVQGLQVFFLIVLAAVHGRKIRIVMITIVLTSITAMNMLQENGRLLASIGSFPITLGALLTGLEKALTLIGMIYLSQYMVSGKPRFPGRFGQLLSKQFLYFEHLVTTWKKPEKGKFIESLDIMLEEMEQGILTDEELGLSNPSAHPRDKAEGRRADAWDYGKAAGIVIVFWFGSAMGFAGILP